MRIIAVIPARYGSSRFPGKPLALLNNKPIIQQVYQQVKKSGLFDEILIATDDSRIYEEAMKFNANVVMTSSKHQSGTDRIAEACDKFESDFDIVVNIQGDEPFITKKPLQDLISVFKDKNIQVGSLMHRLESEINNPNNVKVITDNDGFALYFSRSVIPYNRDGLKDILYFKHVGVYAFRRKTLYQFVNLPPSSLEKIEKLEQLRLLENNIKIKMVETNYKGIGIDTPEDLVKAEKIFKEH